MQAMIYVRQLCSALEYLHEMKIIHRDIKPSNLLLSKEIKLADFGLACYEKESKEWNLIGTYQYCAPEIIGEKTEKLKPHSFKTDVWAVGVTLFEMITGKRPFYENDTDLKAKAIQSRFLESIFFFKILLRISLRRPSAKA